MTERGEHTEGIPPEELSWDNPTGKREGGGDTGEAT